MQRRADTATNARAFAYALTLYAIFGDHSNPNKILNSETDIIFSFCMFIKYIFWADRLKKGNENIFI
jgi:hypothetical protein